MFLFFKYPYNKKQKTKANITKCDCIVDFITNEFLNLKDKTDTEEIDKKIKTFNIYEKTIYYAVNEVDENGNQTEQAIYKIKTNGKKNEKIVDLSSSVNTSICIAGDWIYYTDKVEDSPYYFATYRVKTNGENQARVNI